jgi:nicotinate-nucleotide pyrophosphorylase (carboxylating)
MEHSAVSSAARERRVEDALFRGAGLTLDNADYLRTLRAVMDVFLRVDLAPADLTVEAMGLDGAPASAAIVARESGVAGGLEELAYILRSFKVEAALEKSDSERVEPGDTLLRAAGPRARLLSLERAGLNLVQRMSGIATATRALAQRARAGGGRARIVATRKTPWSLLDKRAVHLGGAGTHRLGLSDAILVKNNHLALLAEREEQAAPMAVERAWAQRARAAFIEVEVRSLAAALAAAQTFARLQQTAAPAYPCLLMLDNMTAREAGRVVGALQREKLWDYALVEASGGIAAENVEEYAACGVDAISVGALTHSARALDICQRIL